MVRCICLLGGVLLAAGAGACLLVVDTSGLAEHEGAADGATTPPDGGGSSLVDSGGDARTDACHPAGALALDQSNLVEGDDRSTASEMTSPTRTLVAAGGTIIVAVKWQDVEAAITVSGGDLSWMVDAQSNDHPPIALAHAHAPAGLPSGTPITVHFSAAAPKRVLTGASFVGVAPNVPPRVASVARAPEAPYESTPITTTASDTLVVSAVEMFASDGVWQPMSPTLEGAQNVARRAQDCLAIHYRVETSPGTFTTAASWTGSKHDWSAATVLFEGANRVCP